MFCVPATERVLWRTDGSTVWVGYDDGGALVFNGFDRAHLDGYEYTITVALDDHGIERGFPSY